MTMQDFRRLDPGSEFDADVCVIGSGPAGWTVSSELGESGLRVLVLESGGSRTEDQSDALKETEDVGVPLFNGRWRCLGGTPEITDPWWGNRCIAFDPIDYEARSWVPLSGWPFGPDAIAPFLDRASQHLGAGPYLIDAPKPPPAPRGVSPPDVDTTKLSHAWWWFGRNDTWGPVSFRDAFRERRPSNVRVLVHATVTHLNTTQDGRAIESVEIAGPDGNRGLVRARTVVLCGGGIENARILLYSNRSTPQGVGNAHDLVGRYLMDHPRDINMTITFDTKHAHRVEDMFGHYRMLNGDARKEYAGGLALNPELQRREQLLNCVSWPMTVLAEDDPVEAARRLRRGSSTRRRHDLKLILTQPGAIAAGLKPRLLYDQPMRTRVQKTGLYIASEQLPDPDSRVTLGRSRDRLGLPVARTDWRINSEDLRSQARLAQLIAAEFKRLDLPEAHLAEWVLDGDFGRATLSDGCHPTGTTRMATDPSEGVVDGDCKVHGVDGLYIAGSSVFPTAGHANPTLMIVAMAARLARHLRNTRAVSPPGSRSSGLVDSRNRQEVDA